MTGSTLSSLVHLLSVFLVSERDGNEFSLLQKVRIVVFDHPFLLVSEDYVVQGNSFRFTLGMSLGELAGPHREEKCAHNQICHVFRSSSEVLGRVYNFFQKFWCDGGLSIWWRIPSFKCLEEGLQLGD